MPEPTTPLLLLVLNKHPNKSLVLQTDLKPSFTLSLISISLDLAEQIPFPKVLLYESKKCVTTFVFFIASVKLQQEAQNNQEGWM